MAYSAFAEWFTRRAVPTQATISDTQVEQRRARLIETLTKHRLAHSLLADQSTVRVLDVAEIGAPYTAKECHCDNPLVLRRLVELLEKIA